MATRPPRLEGEPIVGVLPRIRREGHRFWLDARERLGDVFSMKLGPTEVTVLCHPRHAHHVFVTHAGNYRDKGGNAGFRAAIRGLTNDGLSTAESENAVWRQQRDSIQPYFRHPNLEPLTGLLVAAIDEELETWGAYADAGEAFDLGPSLSRIAIAVIVRSMFGSTMGAEDADLLAANSRIVMDSIWDAIEAASFPDRGPGSRERRQEAATETVVRTAMNLIEKRLADDRAPEDLISVLVSLRDDERVEYMTDRLLRDESVSLLLAGYEIMSSTTQFALALLMRHPEAMARARAEVAEVLGDRTPTHGDMPRLDYCRMVVCEALRLYSPSYQLQRMATEDDEIDGFHIEAGSIVSISLHAMHHHPDQWHDPERFDPDRFTPERTRARHRLAWLPFGGGRRACLAMRYSIIQGQLVLAQTLQRYALEPVSDDPIAVHMGTILRPADGVRARLRRRTPRPQRGTHG